MPRMRGSPHVAKRTPDVTATLREHRAPSLPNSAKWGHNGTWREGGPAMTRHPIEATADRRRPTVGSLAEQARHINLLRLPRMGRGPANRCVCDRLHVRTQPAVGSERRSKNAHHQLTTHPGGAHAASCTTTNFAATTSAHVLLASTGSATTPPIRRQRKVSHHELKQWPPTSEATRLYFSRGVRVASAPSAPVPI